MSNAKKALKALSDEMTIRYTQRPATPEKVRCPVCSSRDLQVTERRYNPLVRVNGQFADADHFRCKACGATFAMAYWSE